MNKKSGIKYKYMIRKLNGLLPVVAELVSGIKSQARFHICLISWNSLVRLHPVIIKINHTLSTIINDVRYHWHKSATYLPSIKDRKASIKDVAAQCQAMPVLQSLFSQRSPLILLQPISMDISFYAIPIIRCTSIKPFITPSV